jgi:hypothetical protein
MDELQERAEIDRLLEEQRKDDTSFVSPEFNTLDTVPIETLADALAVGPDGEIVMFGQKEKGSVLTGAAAYHGTASGYRHHKCRCERCKAAKAASVRGERLRRKEKDAA